MLASRDSQASPGTETAEPAELTAVSCVLAPIARRTAVGGEIEAQTASMVSTSRVVSHATVSSSATPPATQARRRTDRIVSALFLCYTAWCEPWLHNKAARARNEPLAAGL